MSSSHSLPARRRPWLVFASIAAVGLTLVVAVPAPRPDRAPVERLPLVLALSELDDVPLSCSAADGKNVRVAWTRPDSWGDARLRRVGVWIWDVEARKGAWSMPRGFDEDGARVSFIVPRRVFRGGARYVLRLWAQVEDDRGALVRLAPRGTTWKAP